MIETYVQIGIFAMSMTSSFLNSAKTARLRLCGYIVAAIGQPLWFYTTITKQQWGLVALSVWYCFIVFRGIRNNLPYKTEQK